MVDQNGAKTLKKWDPIDYKIAQLLIENPAATDDEIAKTIGINRMTVNRRRNHGGVSKLIDTTIGLPIENIKRLMSKSLIRLEQLMDEADPRIRGFAAVQLLRFAIQLNLSGQTASLTNENTDVVYVTEWGNASEN